MKTLATMKVGAEDTLDGVLARVAVLQERLAGRPWALVIACVDCPELFLALRDHRGVNTCATHVKVVRAGRGSERAHLEEACKSFEALGFTRPSKMLPKSVSATSKGYGPGDLSVVCVHYNPCGYRKPVENLLKFAAQWEANPDWPPVHLMWIEEGVPEPAKAGTPYLKGFPNLPASWTVHRLSVTHPLWWKECAINAAVAKHVTTPLVAWIDADLMFSNRDWPAETRELLATYPVVQLWESGDWLDEAGGIERQRQSIAKWLLDLRAGPEWRGIPKYFGSNGPGGALAAHRMLFDHWGLYDKMIVGSGDSVFMSACYQAEQPWLMENHNPAITKDVEHWAAGVGQYVRGQVGCVSGHITHLFHGRWADRQYRDRQYYLADFDPRDLVPDGHGLLKWADGVAERKPELLRRVREYFERRREDGEGGEGKGEGLTTESTKSTEGEKDHGKSLHQRDHD